MRPDSPSQSPDPAVIDWLLSGLFRRVYFAVDMGVLACLEYPPDSFNAFTESHIARPLRALAEVLRLAAAEGGAVGADKPLEGVAMWSEILAASMVAMGDFRSLPPAQLRETADRFGAAWFSLRRCVEELADVLGTSPQTLRDVRRDREQGVRATLDGLCEAMEVEHRRTARP